MMKVVQGTFRQIPYWKLRGRFHSCGYRDQEVAEHSGIGRYTMSARMNGHQPWTSNKNKNNNNSDTKVSDSNSAEALPPTLKSRFSPPDVETVKSYFAEKGGTEGQAIRFHAYYESNGWKVGRNPMKNWKAAASGWISRDRDEAKKANAPRNRAFMASRPAEEAENAKNFLADAARRRPLKKQ